MAAKITELIDKIDNVELIRDEIAAILAVELAEQQTLATAAGKDPDLWKLRVFSERANPWAEFIDSPTQSEGVPLVNVAIDSINYDDSASNTVLRQKATAVYHLDCYGYGVSVDDPTGGHAPGDAEAAFEAQRAVRLVRNILMAGTYSYLGLRGLVWSRGIQSIQLFQPESEAQPVQQILAARIQFEVAFNEFSPQVQGEALELVSVTVKRAETGEIYIEADFPTTSPP